MLCRRLAFRVWRAELLPPYVAGFCDLYTYARMSSFLRLRASRYLAAVCWPACCYGWAVSSAGTDFWFDLFKSAMWVSILTFSSLLASELLAWAASLSWRNFCRAEVPNSDDLTRGVVPAVPPKNEPVDPLRFYAPNTVLHCWPSPPSGVAIPTSETLVWLCTVWNILFWVPTKRSLRRRSWGTESLAQVRLWWSPKIWFMVFEGLPCRS